MDPLTEQNSTKLCRPCGRVLPLSDFYRDKTRKDGHCSPCKSCKKAWYEANKEGRAAYHQAWYEENRERRKAQIREYGAAHREESVARSQAWTKANREWVAERRQAHYLKNRERHAQYAKEYYLNNKADYIERWRKRRAMLAGLTEHHTNEDVAAKHAEQGGLCYWCKKSLDGTFEVDHVIPLSRGGGDDPGNICCACVYCNRSKGSRMPWEFSDRLF